MTSVGQLCKEAQSRLPTERRRKLASLSSMKDIADEAKRRVDQQIRIGSVIGHKPPAPETSLQIAERMFKLLDEAQALSRLWAQAMLNESKAVKPVDKPLFKPAEVQETPDLPRSVLVVGNLTTGQRHSLRATLLSKVPSGSVTLVFASEFDMIHGQQQWRSTNFIMLHSHHFLETPPKTAGDVYHVSDMTDLIHKFKEVFQK